tara:strand:- start:1157 stop:2494 length:1338 start_codon:yes stop_codon:yes gene_type:complete
MRNRLNFEKEGYRDRNNSISYIREAYGINFDLRNHKISESFHNDFEKMALENKILEKFQGIYEGEKANNTEQKSITHFEYRKKDPQKKFINEIKFMLAKADQISKNSFDKIIFFGIGGSQLGPLFLGESLISDFNKKVVMITGSDPEEFLEKVSDINLEKCIFIIASKSFSTIETLNAFESVTNKKYLGATYAITSNIEEAEKYGIDKEKIIPFDRSTGGRFSSWSPISILLAIFEGEMKYKSFLEGGMKADQDLLDNKTTSPSFMLSCQDIYNNNILNNQTTLVLNYDWKLRSFSKYVQQLEMESNGKSINQNNEEIDVDTCPIIWGGYGPESQHSFYQMIYQGTKDFNIYIIASISESLNFYQFKGQSESFIIGSEIGVDDYKRTKYRTPTLITLDKISPISIGSLMATWENKTILNSLFWNINAFDQWGVELGKLNTQKYYK